MRCGNGCIFLDGLGREVELELHGVSHARDQRDLRDTDSPVGVANRAARAAGEAVRRLRGDGRVEGDWAAHAADSQIALDPDRHRLADAGGVRQSAEYRWGE